MTALIYCTGRSNPFRVKGSPDDVRMELLKAATSIEGNYQPEQNGYFWAGESPAFVQFEQARTRKPVFINPAAVSAIE